MTSSVEAVDRLYARWNAEGLPALMDAVDPAIELVCDPLRPAATALHGVEGWLWWVDRWESTYEAVQITVDGLVPLDAEHVLALVSIAANRRVTRTRLHWAAAHLWTVRDGRIAGWETHLDLAVALGTLRDAA